VICCGRPQPMAMTLSRKLVASKSHKIRLAPGSSARVSQCRETWLRGHHQKPTKMNSEPVRGHRYVWPHRAS
jgi:hypothetical protein